MPIDMMTASGQPVPIIGFGPEHVNWRAIAASLAKQCRWNGHTSTFYSVAQHCLLVADLLPPELRPYGLIHDAHEAYTGDITTPVKRAIASVEKDRHSGIEAIQAMLDASLYASAGLTYPIPATIQEQVGWADQIALATEARDLLGMTSASLTHLPPSPTRIRPMSWDKAEEALWQRFQITLSAKDQS